MKNAFTKFAFFILLILSCTQCVTESGNIGQFYGIWSLKSMLVDSKPADIICSQYFWKFQGSVIFIAKTDSLHQFNNSIGSWEESDNNLILNFTYKNDNAGSEHLPTFNPPPELLIPARAVTTMKIVKMTDKDLILEYTTSEGALVTYNLNKLK